MCSPPLRLSVVRPSETLQLQPVARATRPLRNFAPPIRAEKARKLAAPARCASSVIWLYNGNRDYFDCEYPTKLLRVLLRNSLRLKTLPKRSDVSEDLLTFLGVPKRSTFFDKLIEPAFIANPARGSNIVDDTQQRRQIGKFACLDAQWSNNDSVEF